MAVTWLENELARVLPVGKGDENGNVTVRKVFVPYSYLPLANLVALEQNLRGTTTLSSETGAILRLLPWQDPDQPAKRVTRVDFQGYGYGKTRVPAVDPTLPMETAVAVQRWLLTVYYNTVPYETGAGTKVGGTSVGDYPYIAGNSVADETLRYMTKVTRPGLHLATPPVGSIYLDQGPGQQRIPLGVPSPIIIPESQVEVTWYFLCDGVYPSSAIKMCRGKVNKNAMTLPAGRDGQATYPAETLALDGVRDIPVTFPDGSKGIHLVFSFICREGTGAAGEDINLNTLPDNLGVWQKAYRGEAASVTDKIFQTTNAFSYLFKSQRAWVLSPPPP